MYSLNNYLKKTIVCTYISILLHGISLNAQDPFPGKAIIMDGNVNDYVICNPVANFPDTALTISFWMKTTNVTNDGSPISYATTIHDNTFLLFNYKNFVIYVNNVNTGQTGISANDGFWHHIAVSWRSIGGQVKLYKDGILEYSGSIASGFSFPDSGALVFGQEQDTIGGGFSTGQAFNGEIEEVCLWNRVRSIDQIRENMHLTLPGIDSSLISYWQFNEDSAFTAYDVMENNHASIYKGIGSPWRNSGAPVGGGSIYSNFINTTGVFNFDSTGISMDVTAKSGGDLFIVTKLDNKPNINPNLPFINAFEDQYWIVNKFGSGTITADITFTPNENITSGDEISPENLLLFRRESTSDVNWIDSTQASAADSINNTVRFNDLTDFGQFQIIRGYHGFEEIDTGLDQLAYSSVAWGDYDNDGDLDILLSGLPDNNQTVTKIYRNDPASDSGRTFTDINSGLPGVYVCDGAWGDYDNDGDLDILLSGMDYMTGVKMTKIYRNDPSANEQTHIFTDVNASLPGTFGSSVDWGDYDNDGDLDILLTGRAGTFSNEFSISKVFQNNNGTFTDINAGLLGVSTGDAKWGDYDNDGDPDILITGIIDAGVFSSKIYRNDFDPDSGHVFTDINAGLADMGWSSADWGDYDNDGDLDILLIGNSLSSTIYRNDGGLFTDINVNLPMTFGGSAEWGDYDNDGDLDFLISGIIDASDYKTSIYQNEFHSDSGFIFTEINSGLKGVRWSDAAWGDYDNDGDLDIILTGEANGSYKVTKLYRSNNPLSNSNPFSPNSLSKVISSDSIEFSWDKATDNETPQDGLSYNLLIGNYEYDILIKSPMALVNDGFRSIPALGNTYQANNWSYKISPYFSFPQVITPNYWGVQTIDNAFAGSAFTLDSLDLPIYYLSTINDSVMHLTDTLTWEIQYVDSILDFQIQIDDDSTFNNIEVDEVLSVSLGDSLYYSIHLQYIYGTHNLIPGTKYYWRIKPNYTFGLPTAFTKTVSCFWFEYISSVRDENETGLPKKFALYQNYPNPFNPSTTIKYTLPKSVKVKIEVFNLLGQEIKTLINKHMSSGSHEVEFTAKDLPSGVYLYRIQARDFREVKKMILLQ